MKTSHTKTGFEFRFDAGTFSVFMTRERMPDRTFDVRLEWPDGDPLAPRLSCGFSEFVETGEAADPVIARVMTKLRNATPEFPRDFPEPSFRDALSHWLLFNFGTLFKQGGRAAAP